MMADDQSLRSYKVRDHGSQQMNQQEGMDSNSFTNSYTTSNSYSYSASEMSESYVSEYDDGEDFSNSDDTKSQVVNHISVAEKEQKWVNRSKVLVILVLLVAVAATASSIFLILRNEEEQDFQAQFQNYANQIIAVSQSNALSSFEMIESFSVSITSYASDTEQTWPYVTIPDFAARVDRVVAQSHASRFAFSPLVQPWQYGEWTNYSYGHKIDTFRDDVEYLGLNKTLSSAEMLDARTSPVIFALNFTDPYNIQSDYVNIGQGPWAPFWQGHPIPPYPQNQITNYDLIGGERTGPTYHVAAATKAPVLNFIIGPDASITDRWVYVAESVLIQPIYEQVVNKDEDAEDMEDKNMVGFVWVVMNWIYYFQNLLPDNANGITLVLKSSCGDAISYQINGLEAVQVGTPVDDESANSDGDGGDVHDPAYDSMEVTAPFFRFEYDRSKIPEGICVPELSLHVYPSAELEAEFLTSNPAYYALGVCLIFAFTTIVFVIYDYTVRRRQSKVMARVYRQERIVGDMFPDIIRQRLYRDDSDNAADRKVNSKKEHHNSNRSSISNKELFEQRDTQDIDNDAGGEIAELYPNVSLVFADISGFTAWSSAREPKQVFTLLETLYGRFDKIANRCGVFKVETVGDCYVGCAGLPDACDDHAVRVAKFARGILDAMNGLTKKLEVRLGPDTTDLKLRIGIHSGQVTAGVLRGTRSRFQLFGDAVNMCSRMESTSMRNHIQVSEQTANLLRQNGKGRWVKLREESVSIKGKGNVQTFWLKTKAQSSKKSYMKQPNYTGMEMAAIDEADSDDDSDTEEDTSGHDGDVIIGSPDEQVGDKMERLVQWNTEVLSVLLQQILAARSSSSGGLQSDERAMENLEQNLGIEGTVLDEFVPIISLPNVTDEELQRRKDPRTIMLSPEVKRQLHSYVSAIASMYNSNPFHNFEHASHVTASVRKLLTRITNVDSFGITNDPLTQFSVVFCAIIHDADHPGVPNATLVKEETRHAKMYNEKSVAEQNSVDLAWETLMEPEFANLRACIYQNEDELKRFRQLVVNTVMATDICDKELGAMRKDRWAVAFSGEKVDSTMEEAVNRKATIVIEHLIQASDVSHTMQHWHIFKRWNQRLFFEMYAAYKAGRADKDPSEFWYQGEIGFFDFYVIPLAKKLASCGVFGVSSHEYLGYAEANRAEWAQRGEEIVKEYLALLETNETRTETSESVSSGEEAV